MYQPEMQRESGRLPDLLHNELLIPKFAETD